MFRVLWSAGSRDKSGGTGSVSFTVHLWWWCGAMYSWAPPRYKVHTKKVVKFSTLKHGASSPCSSNTCDYIVVFQDVAKEFKKCKEEQSARLDLSKSQVSYRKTFTRQKVQQQSWQVFLSLCHHRRAMSLSLPKATPTKKSKLTLKNVKVWTRHMPPLLSSDVKLVLIYLNWPSIRLGIVTF